MSTNNKKRGLLTRPRKKEDDKFQDKWAPTPEEMRKAELAVCSSQAQSLKLRGKPRKAQHEQINNENRPNGSRKKAQVLHAKTSKAQILYANALPGTITKKTNNHSGKTKKAIVYAKPIHPLPRPSAPPSLPKEKNMKKAKNKGTKPSRSERLWSTLDHYITLPKQAEETKETEASKSSVLKSSPPPRRPNPFAEDEKVDTTPIRRPNPFAVASPIDVPYDETPNLIESSTNGIQAAAAAAAKSKSLGNKNQRKEAPRRVLFDKSAQYAAPAQPRKSLVQDNIEQEAADLGPISLDEFVPLKSIKVNSDEPIPRTNRPSLGGKLRKSLSQKRQQWKVRNKVSELPEPMHAHERQKPNAKPFKEMNTDESALHQRKHRVQVDGNNITNTIMTMDDAKTSSFSPMKPSPVRRDKSKNAEEANEAVEVMDLTTMSLESFQLSFQENSNACLKDVYEIDYPVHKSLVSGVLSIALPQDVFLLVSTQLSLLDEYIARNKLKGKPEGDRLLVDSILSILKNISAKQTEYRDDFLQDSFEGCIATANSFMWMVEKVEGFMELVATKYPHLTWCDTDPVTWMPCQEAKELSSQFSHDAVLAASSEAVCFIMDDVHDAGLPSLLFSPQWEEELVHNEVSVSMTRILERRISVTSKWLEQDYLFHKFVGALVRATICFYMEGIVQKAERLRSAGRTLGKTAARKKVAFRNPRKACGRLSDDVAVLQDYFEDIAEENIALARVISREFSFLSLLVECMLQAERNQNNDVDIAEFVFAMHKETGANFDVTKFFMSDVWLLMGPKGEHHRVESSINEMHEELRVFTVEDLQTVAMANADMNGFKLHEVMLSLYKERIKNERTYIALAEGAIKQTRRDIKKELKNTELRVQYFFEDLQEDFAALNGSLPTLGEF
ncbi:MAG: hypothetical protein SGBAC_008962 [Bacillariaceae sp.]